MKKILVLLFLFSVTLFANAKSMAEIWKTMPDSLMPYVDRNHRLEMVEFIGMGLHGDVDNLLGSKSTMDTLTSDFTQVRVSKALVMQVKRLSHQKGDSILCVVRTWLGPEKSSDIQLFTEDWQPINNSPFGTGTLNRILPMLIVKPENITKQRFQELRAGLDFSMPFFSLSVNKEELQISLSTPVQVQKDMVETEHIKKSVILKWNGSLFKEI